MPDKPTEVNESKADIAAELELFRYSYLKSAIKQSDQEHNGFGFSSVVILLLSNVTRLHYHIKNAKKYLADLNLSPNSEECQFYSGEIKRLEARLERYKQALTLVRDNDGEYHGNGKAAYGLFEIKED